MRRYGIMLTGGMFFEMFTGFSGGRLTAAEPVPAHEAPLDPVVVKGLGWLAEAQAADGGWGAGSHARQEIRDPHGVQTDPATTAFAGLALLRAGNTTTSGDYRVPLQRALEYLVAAVENSSSLGPRITTVEGTQPQAKLGNLVDTSLAAIFLARLSPTLTDDSPWKKRVDAAWQVCLRKLEKSQAENGSWNVGGWAPVLQSSLSCTALELGQHGGQRVDDRVLRKSREYQQGNFDADTKRTAADAAAGVELYAVAGSARASAVQAKEAQARLDEAKRDGKLKTDAPISVDNLEKAGVKREEAVQLNRAFALNEAQAKRVLDDESLLQGFGSNGGEEFLSYMMTSESLVIGGGQDWKTWREKIHGRLVKIQNPDGSWAGHHCITSPVFCTAAVLQCLTVDRDAPMLTRLAQGRTPAKPQ